MGGEYQHHSRIFLQRCASAEQEAGQECTASELSWAVSFLFKCSLIMDEE